MNHSLVNSVVTMQALQQKLDMISHNIANMDTRGYKRKEARFVDVLNTVQQQPDTLQQMGRLSTLGLNQGWGSRLGGVYTDMSQGILTQTNESLDLGLDGNAMFEISLSSVAENGEISSQPGWTRDGNFMLSMNPEDEQTYLLTTRSGHGVKGMDDEVIQIPVDHHVKVSSSGIIMAYDERRPEADPVYVGQLKLVQAMHADLLELHGENVYRLPGPLLPFSEQMLRVLENEDAVSVRQGFLELSNVNLADEITEVMLVQRAFQLNARTIQSSDAMMNMANNLRG